MSIERFTKRKVATAAQVIAGGLHTGHTSAATFDRWPAVIVPASGTYRIYADSADGLATTVANTSLVDATDEVWYPETTPAVGGTPLVIGRDYDVVVMQDTNKNAIFRLEVPVPVLTTDSPISVGASPTDNNVTLTWTSAFNVATKVYRTAIYTVSGSPPSEFNLISEVDPVTTPATSGTYVDDVADAVASDYVSYFVANENGKSNIVEVSFVA